MITREKLTTKTLTLLFTMTVHLLLLKLWFLVLEKNVQKNLVTQQVELFLFFGHCKYLAGRFFFNLEGAL
jgi:hypothetical protein